MSSAIASGDGRICDNRGIIQAMLRRFLDRLYEGAGMAAALCLMLILVVIVAQMVARWSGISFPGSTAYAGYLMAAASFLAFPYALNCDSHVRVGLFLNALGERRFWAELWCFGIGSVLTCWLAFYACRLVHWSIVLHDISQERDMTPLWIPQLPVAAGSILLAICFLDNFISLLVRGRHNVASELRQAEA